MRHPIAIALVTVAVTSCAAWPGASPSGSVTPSVSGPPVMECVTGIDRSTCDRATSVALEAVASSGRTPTRLWISSGLLAPDADLLFDPTAEFPYPNPPDGGTWIGSAEVAFAETDEHAGMNIAAVGDRLEAVLTGFRVPPSAWCSGTCPSASTTDGSFRLELVLPHLDWKASDAITGTAILSFAGSAPTTVYGSGSSVINFSYVEVGGTRRVDPVWTADCAPHSIDPATPINEPLGRSGAMPNDDPNAAFLRSFLTAPDTRLPVGTWDITALAIFTEGVACEGGPHSMTATMRVTVGE